MNVLANIIAWFRALFEDAPDCAYCGKVLGEGEYYSCDECFAQEMESWP